MIEVVNLCKSFKQVTAVDNISFEVKKGEIFAFLGPNGAGKSTTIKMLTTTLLPSSGTMKINGHDVASEKNEVRKNIGVIFQDYSLDNQLTAYENMLYHAIFYQVPKAQRKAKIEQLLGHVGLLDRKNNLVKTFSGGMKRRVEIVRGLLHDPNILFLDEPTLGLDVQTKTFLWDHIRKNNAEKEITIFFTTHNMDEAEKIATHIAIIDHGKIMMMGTAAQIKEQTGTGSLEEAFLKLTGRNIREQSADNLEMFRKRFSR